VDDIYSKYSTESLSGMFSKIKLEGQELLSEIENRLRGYKGISQVKNKETSLKFVLFDNTIIIRIELPKDGIREDKGEICTYLKTNNGLERLKHPAILYRNSYIFIENIEEITRKKMVETIIDNLVPMLLKERRIVFKKSPKSEVKDKG